MGGDGVTTSHGKGIGGRLASRKAEVRRQMDLSWFIAQDKENVAVFSDNVVEPLQRSPLPVGYPRLPLQDITAILSPLNQPREDEDESGGRKRPKQREGPKKLSRPCPPVIEEVAEATSKIKSSNKDTVTVPESSEAGSTELAVPAAPELSEILSTLSSKVEQQGTEEVVLKLAVNESNVEVQFVAESSYLVKKTVDKSRTLGRGAAASSPSSHKTKRRKPLPKPTPGRNVARFR